MIGEFLVVEEIPFLPEDVIERSASAIHLNGMMEDLKDDNSIIVLHQLGREIFGATIGRICNGYEHREYGKQCGIVIAEGLPKFKLDKRFALKEKDGIRYTMCTVSDDCVGMPSNWLY